MSLLNRRMMLGNEEVNSSTNINEDLKFISGGVNGMILAQNGKADIWSPGFVSGYIPINPTERFEYKTTLTSWNKIAFYQGKSVDEFISINSCGTYGGGTFQIGQETSIPIPSNAKYMRCAFVAKDLSISYIKRIL